MRRFTLAHPCRLLVVLVSLLTLAACDKDNEPVQQDKLLQIESIKMGPDSEKYPFPLHFFKYQYDHKGRVSSIRVNERTDREDIINITYRGNEIIYQSSDGDTEICQIDEDGRVIYLSNRHSGPGGESQFTSSFEYDEEGRMSSQTDKSNSKLMWSIQYSWEGDLLRSVTRTENNGYGHTEFCSYKDIDNVAHINVNGVGSDLSMLYPGLFGKVPAKLLDRVRIEESNQPHSAYSKTYIYHYTLDKRNRPIKIIEKLEDNGTDGHVYEEDYITEITYVVK